MNDFIFTITGKADSKIDVFASIKNSSLWNNRSQRHEEYISDLQCPSCGKNEAYLYFNNPFLLKCNRRNECTETTQLGYSQGPAKPYGGPHGSLIAEHNYTDAKGNLLFQIARYEPKNYRARTLGKNGKWIPNIKGVRLVPYKLPEVIAAGQVFIVEGEKDADSLADLGLTASCNPFGANKWRKEFNKHFSGKEVIIIPDNDKAGMDHARNVAGSLMGTAETIKILELPGLREGGDVTDWLEAGGTKEELLELSSNADEESPESYDEDSPEAHTGFMAELNKKHAVVSLGGRCFVMNEVVDPISNRPDITFSSFKDFMNLHMNVRTKPTVSCPQGMELAYLWLLWKGRRQYKGVVFKPGKELPGYYNLYKGFAVDPKPGDWSLLQEHILENIAGGSKEAYEYILNWVAHMFQFPGGGKPGTSIVLRGKQGTGKGCFINQLGRIMGNHYLHITNPSLISGRFNGHLKNALLVFCDECIWAGDKEAEGNLKGLITEDELTIEQKGKDAYTVDNFIRLVVASNNDWVIPAGPEERRFFVLDVSDKRMQDRSYFGKIVRQMDNGGREAMLYDLLNRDISEVDLGKFPRTTALLDQIVSSMSPEQKFWYECLCRESVLSDNEQWAEKVETKQLYDEFIEFSGKLGYKYRTQSSEFMKKLLSLCPGLQKRRASEGKRPNMYRVPTLVECRKAFEMAVKFPIDWHTPVMEGKLTDLDGYITNTGPFAELESQLNEGEAA